MSTDKISDHQMPSSIVDAQLQRLLEIVNQYQQHQCDELMEQARQGSREIIHHTYHNARTRLRNHILEDRRQLEQSLASTRARQHTFTMQQKHKASRKFLEDAWELLKIRLVQRWNNPELKILWIKGVIDTALKSLPAQEWRIVSGDALSASDKKQWVDYIKTKSEISVVFSEESGIEAGLRISGGDAIVDGTSTGLMSDRVRIESEILAQCPQCIVHSRAADSK